MTHLGRVYHVRRMPVDDELLREARAARQRAVDLQQASDQAQVAYQHTIRRLHAAGASLREIADALGLSYQRVHQIVDVTGGKGALKGCRADVACTFCGEPQIGGPQLVAGPGVYICDRCVRVAERVAVSEAGRGSGWTRHSAEAGAGPRCSFCGKRHRGRRDLVGIPDRRPVGKYAGRRAQPGRGVWVCSECLGLCAEILARQST